MPQVPLAEHHDMIKAVPSYRADQPFHMAILPWWSRFDLATTTLLASAMVLCPCVRARLDTATMLSEGCSTVPGPVNTNEQEFVVRLLAGLTVRGCARSASEEPCEQSSF